MWVMTLIMEEMLSFLVVAVHLKVMVSATAIRFDRLQDDPFEEPLLQMHLYIDRRHGGLFSCPFGLRRFPVWRGRSNLQNTARYVLRRSKLREPLKTSCSAEGWG